MAKKAVKNPGLKAVGIFILIFTVAAGFLVGLPMMWDGQREVFGRYGEPEQADYVKFYLGVALVCLPAAFWAAFSYYSESKR